MNTKPHLQLVSNEATVGSVGADTIETLLPPLGVLGIATGDTPLPIYRELAHRTAIGEFDLSRGALVALDEYVGLPADDLNSYRFYTDKHVAVPLGISEHRTFVPNGASDDPHRSALEFEEQISAIGPVDVQIVGIGTNCHLGFNEPGSEFSSRTRVVTLSISTRHANARHFRGDLAQVPTRAITQGLATIMNARAIVLVARGASKAAALAAALRGPITVETPASILQRHPCLTVIADTAAARLL